MAINAGSIIASLDLDTGQFSTKLEKAQKQTDGFAGKLKGYGGAFEDLGKGLTLGVTAPIAGLGAVAGKSAIEFESAFAGVIKTVDATDGQLAKLETGIRGMSKEIPASATAIAGVAEAAGQLGIETENILGFTRVMIDLGEATNLSADEAATALARLANITGMSQQDFDRLGSTIVDLGNNLATTEAEIVAMGLRLAGAGSQIGLTEAQIMSFAGALSSVGIEAEAGGSAFSKVMIDMQLAVETNSERLREFADVAGMSVSEFSKAFKEDAAGAIITFIQGLGNAEEKGLSAIKILDDMGISEVRLRDALLRASGASDVFNNSLVIGTKAWKENTALTKEAEQRYKTTASQIEIAKNHLTDAGITIGEIVVPHLVSMSEAVKNGAEWFSQLNPETQESIVKMAGLAAAIGPVVFVGGKMATNLGSIIGLFSKFSDGAKVATTASSTLAGASGLGSVVLNGYKAGGVIASLGGAAGTGGALGGLTSGLGASLAAINPWVLGIGAAAVGGYALYKTLNQEVIPEVDLFADKVEYSTSAMDEFSYTVGDSMVAAVTKISEGTKKAVEAYLELDETVKFHTDNIYINSTTVTQDMVNEISGQYRTMAETIISATEERAAQELAIMEGFFADNMILTEREQRELLGQHNSYYENKKFTTERYEEEINAIWQRASDENRKVTKEEFEQIERLRQGMKEQAIQVLSEQEIEAKIILERMKEYNVRVTAEQASEHIKELNRARDEAISAAEEEYEKTVAMWIRKRDEAGEISEEQAGKLIKEAQRQRDETIKAAEDTRTKAVDTIYGMNKDLVDNVDATTGKIITWWDKLFNTWDKWQPETKIFNVQFNPLFDSNEDERVTYLKNAYQARADAYRNSLNQMVEDTKSTADVIETTTKNTSNNIASTVRNASNSVKDTSKSVHDTVSEHLNGITSKVNNSVAIIEKELELWKLQNNLTEESSEYLTQQIEVQTQKHELLNEQIAATTNALNTAILEYGEGSNEALNYKNALLDLQIQQEKLKDSIDSANSSLLKQRTLTSGEKASRAKSLNDLLESGWITPESMANAGDNILDLISGYAKGTNYAPGGWALVGEEGPELVELPRASKVYTNQESREILSKSRGDVIQNITLISPTPLSPSESARKYKQASQQLAMEWGY